MYLFAELSTLPAVSQPNDAKLVIDPAWELLVEIFEEFLLGDSAEYLEGHGVAIYSALTLSDTIRKEVIKVVGDEVLLVDSISKEISKRFVDFVEFSDERTKELIKRVYESLGFADDSSEELSPDPEMLQAIVDYLVLTDNVSIAGIISTFRNSTSVVDRGGTGKVESVSETSSNIEGIGASSHKSHIDTDTSSKVNIHREIETESDIN